MNANTQDPVSGELVSVESSINQALQQITKAQIDQQVATAHAYPRSIDRFQKNATKMVGLNEETAASCIYSRPVGGGKFAEGMSIRMAEIVGNCYGNLRVQTFIVEMTPRYVKARGEAHDLETNFASSAEVIESTVDKHNNPYSERMRIVVAKAALAKARRDAIFSVVPRALCVGLELEARRVAIGDSVTFEKRRGQAVAWIKSLGIDPARAFAALGINGEADIGIEHLATLTGIKTAIKEGDATVDESFPPLAKSQTRVEAAKDALTDKPAGNGATDSKPAVDKESGYIPQFDAKTAEAELRKAKTSKALNEARTTVWKDFKDSSRDVPMPVEAAYHEMAESLRLKEAKV